MDIAELIVGLAGIYTGYKSLKSGLAGAEPEESKRIDKVMSVTPFRASIYDVRNINERIRHVMGQVIRGRANPQVRELAVRTVSQKCGREWCIPEKNYEDEVHAIYGMVRKNVRYVRDTYGMDLFQSPSRTLQFGGGDCDDFTIIISSLLQSIGYPVRLRVIRTKGSPEWNHIYCMVGIPPRDPRKWMPVDGSVGFGADWEAPKKIVAQIRDFPVP